ncbi:prephenate dehydratase [Streptomyces sp. NPDC050504]|uniref:prephenate dehydratase n=1 Tax=Streptomyces sp. NPDC050504 TaxID=3365618 RepID=UPI00378E3DE1
MSYAYLGPAGTFTQAALRTLSPPSAAVPSRPFPTVPQTLDAVRSGACQAAVVPVENSVKGVVPATLDQLVSTGLHITAEAEVPVTFALMAPEGVELDDVERVLSHPHALAQCAPWLAERLPGAVTAATGSTAGAALEVAGLSGNRGAGGSGGVAGRTAAIAAPLAAELYGLRILASGIGQRAEAVTRFVSVRPAWLPPERTGHDRTSLVLTPGADGPGALVGVLSVFSAHGVSLTWIQSWPTGDRLGSYRFFIDVAGHIEDPHVWAAMSELSGTGASVRFLGSYPRVGPRGGPVGPDAGLAGAGAEAGRVLVGAGMR